MVRDRLRALALAALLACGLAATGSAQTPVPAAQTEDAEKSSLVRFVEDTISTPDRRIRLGRIDGALSSDVRIGSITIADRKGIWLEIVDAHLVWSRTALLRGRLEVDSLEAGAIRVARKPEASAVPSATASPTFEMPDLPVALRIGRLAVPDLTLAEPVVGFPARFSLEGAARLDGEAIDTRFAVRRLDAPGRIDLRLAHATATKKLDLDLTLDEPNGGFLTSALDIRGRPSLALTVKGSAPIDAFAADLTLDADGRRLIAGRGTVTRGEAGRRIVVNADGSLAPLVSDAWGAYFAGRSTLDVAVETRDGGGTRLERAEIVSGAASLRATGELAADGFPTSLTVAAELGRGDVAVPVPGGRAKRASLAITYGDRAPWKATLRLEDFQGAEARLATADVTASGTARDLADPAKRALAFDLSGTLAGLAAARPGEAPALRSPTRIGGRGAWQAGRPTTVERLAIEDGNLAATWTGSIGANEIAGVWRVAVADLAPFSGLAERRLGGGVDLAARGAYRPVGGAFDLTVDGTSSDLVTGSKAVDGLLRGRTRLVGRVARSTEGLTVEGFAVDGSSLEARASGTLGRATGDLRLGAAIRDVGVTTPAARGRVALDARLSGSMATPTVAVAIAAPAVTLQGRALKQGSLRFDGRLGDGTLDGVLAIAGDLAGKRLEGGAKLASLSGGGHRVEGLRLAAGKSRIDGEATIGPTGLADGSLRLSIADLGDLAPLLLIDAKGAVDARATLSSRDGSQSATAVGTARGLLVEGIGIAGADFDLTAVDLFGTPAVSGRAEVGRITAAGTTVGSLRAEATTGADRVTRFSVAAAGVSAAPLTAAGLGTATVNSRGSLDGRTVRFDTDVRAGRGIALTARGSTTLDAADLAVTVAGTLPLAAADGALRERAAKLSGTATLDVRVSGSAREPRLAGTITVAGAGLTDPETGFRLSGGNGRIRLADGRASFESLVATTGSAGTIAVSGSIGIPPTPDLPADLTIRLARAHVTNGDLLTAELSGLLTVKGPLASGPVIGGTLTVDRAEIAIPERFAGRTTVLDTAHRAPSAAVSRTIAKARLSEGRRSSKQAGGFALALTVEAPSKVFVRGRGLDAELGGRVRLDGPVDRLAPVGAFRLVRGRLDVVGQRVDFSRGSVTLVGSLDPDIDFTADSTRGTVTVTARVHGKASDPRIALTASEDLPQDEILSRFLFGRSITQLSPVQVVRLTMAVAQLAGAGQSADLMGKIRKSTGLDDLDIATDAQGNAALKAGRYVTDKVYLGVTTGAKGDAAGTINLDITKTLKARGSAGSEGSSLGVFFEKDY